MVLIKKKKIKIMLLFPPVFQPFQPYLSLPSLTAFLERKGYKVIQRDINIEAYDRFLTEKMLKVSYKNALKRFVYLKYKTPLSSEEEREYLLLSEVILNASSLIKNIEKFKNTFKDKDSLCSIKRYKLAWQMLSEGLKLISAEFYPTEFTLKKYITPYNFYSIKDIFKAVSDKKTNIFLNYFKDYVIPDITDYKPDLVGVSIVGDYQIIPGFTLAYLIKKTLPRTHITVGGPIFTLVKDEIRKNKELFSLVDSFIVHEGETSLWRLAENIGNGKDLSRVPNIIYYKKGRIYYNPIFSEDINLLPSPSYDGFPLDLYLSPKPILSILPARSCYWRRCAFCNSFKIFQKYNVRKPYLVIKDIKYLKERYSTDYFAFVNESMSPKQLRDISEAIIQNNLKVIWYAGVRFDPAIDSQLCNLIKKAGCRLLMFGLESGSQRVLDLMEKGYKKETIKNILRHCNNEKIAVHLYCLIGFPGEKKEEAYQTLDFILENKKILESKGFATVVSAFQLKKDSKVAHFPSRYGIKIIDKNNNLNLMYQYRMKEGISCREVQKVSSYINEELTRNFNLEAIHVYHKIFLI
ncbi:MAG: B12-binding domain-containing radical SAM protein [Candidatus Omnitrophica bacterium]|nr:B12-binding domain-containing radical SAM protein [Candidatus Omnitrophota bacterium]